MTPLDTLETFLPKVWPNKHNTTPEKAKHINNEDFYAQLEIDFLLARHPEDTDSAWLLPRLYDGTYSGSQNHKFSKAACEYICNLKKVGTDAKKAIARKRLIGFFKDHLKNVGFMTQEQFARYIRFYARDVFAILMVANMRKDDKVSELCRSWINGLCWWLNETCYPLVEDPKEWNGVIITPGCRREFSPEILDAFLFKLCLASMGKNQTLPYERPSNVDDDATQLGWRASSMMNGGMPRASDYWMGLECYVEGLLDFVRPVKPKLLLPLEVKRVKTGILSYFPRIVGRPGGGPILAACLFIEGKDRVNFVLGEHQLPPATKWGFDPMSMKLKEVID